MKEIIDPKKVKDFIEKKGGSTSLNRARTPEQFLVMKHDEEAGKCTFCRKLNEEKNWIFRGRNWNIKYNDFPYENHDLHLLIIYKQHVDEFIGIDPTAWKELAKMLLKLKEDFRLPAINLVMRFGDPVLRSSTIHHLHLHIQLPSKEIVAKNVKTTIGDRFREAQMLSDSSHWINNPDNLLVDSGIGSWRVVIDPNESPFQFKKIFLVPNNPDYLSRHEYFFICCFVSLMAHCEEIVEKLSIRGGGLVFRLGNPDYTGGKFGYYPYMTIYCPNGKGRVQATFVPSLLGNEKAPCKATFCKGFEGEELEKLQKRMNLFQSL